MAQNQRTSIEAEGPEEPGSSPASRGANTRYVLTNEEERIQETTESGRREGSIPKRGQLSNDVKSCRAGAMDLVQWKLRALSIPVSVQWWKRMYNRREGGETRRK